MGPAASLVRRATSRGRFMALFVAVGMAVVIALVGATSASAAPKPTPTPTPKQATKHAKHAPRKVDLTVRLTKKADALAGKRITYTVVVSNKGPARATGVAISFTTSAALGKVRTKISHGSCDRGRKHTSCHWFRSLAAGKSATVTISGVVPKKMAPGTDVTNTVTVRSTTKRINKANDRATANYQLAIPSLPAPVIAPSPSINPTGKLAKFTNTAAKVADFSTRVATWTVIILGAGLLWFIVGLALHHRRRVRDADFDRNDEDD